MADTPLDLRHGARRRADGSVEWNVWAPRAGRVELVFLDESPARPMQPAGHGWFTHRESADDGGRRYAFRLQHRDRSDQRLLPDPASRLQPEGVHRPSATFFPEDFAWTDSAWRGLPLSDLVFYELHIGTFTDAGTFAAVEARLPALRDLGITALELMPVAQFPGSRGWGYDGVHPFAVQNTYGGPRALQRLVDACHRHQLAVFLDVVYNHLGPEGNYAGEFGPYFTPKYATPWGEAWNYDDDGSDAVRQFVCENVAYWLRDFHFDGLRLDAIHAIVDMSPMHILRDIQRTADAIAAETGRTVHIVAESCLNDVRLLDPPEQKQGYGLSGQWSDDFHHAVHTLLTGERDGYYADFGRPEDLVKAFNNTFVYDGCHSKRHGGPRGFPDGGHSREKFIVSVQNHDQIGNRSHGDRFGTLLSPERQRLAAAVMLLSPFTPLLFMGEEYGEQRPFPFFCSFCDSGLVEAVRTGRREEFREFAWRGEIPDPHDDATFRAAKLSWSWPDGTPQAELRSWYRWLLEVRRSRFVPGDRRGTAAWHRSPTAAAAEGVLEIVRPGREEDSQIVALLNFGSTAVPLSAACSNALSLAEGRVLPMPAATDVDPASPLAPFEIRLYELGKGAR